MRARAHLDDVDARAVAHELDLALDVLRRVGLKGQDLDRDVLSRARAPVDRAVGAAANGLHQHGAG